jgi:hypothetical protein
VEQDFVSRLEQKYNSLDKSSSEYQYFDNVKWFVDDPNIRRGIFISPTHSTIDQRIEHMTKKRPELGLEPLPFQEMTLSGDFRAIRYTTIGEEPTNVVWVEYTKRANLGSGYSIGSITIEMDKDIFDESAFSAVVNSFEYE